MSEHTPGPWSHDGEDIDAGSVAVATIHHREGAMFKTRGPVPTEAQAVANARLIAAAPELLGALRQLGNEANDAIDAEDLNLIRAETLAEALQAISKATNPQHKAKA